MTNYARAPVRSPARVSHEQVGANAQRPLAGMSGRSSARTSRLIGQNETATSPAVVCGGPLAARSGRFSRTHPAAAAFEASAPAASS